jgi:hypothetical protein
MAMLVSSAVVEQHAPADAAEAGDVADLGHADDERREHQRQHEHLEEFQEQLAGGLR